MRWFLVAAYSTRSGSVRRGFINILYYVAFGWIGQKLPAGREPVEPGRRDR